MKEKVAIIGMGCVFPGALDFTEYWQNIVEGFFRHHNQGIQKLEQKK